MDVSKSRLQKIITEIKKSKKKVYTISDLSFDTAIREEVLKEIFVAYDPLIYFNDKFNTKDVLDELIKEESRLSEGKTTKRMYIRSKDIAEYSGLVDYIYKNMTVNGGILDTGYVLTKKDLKLISKLLKEEKEKLKNK